MGGAEQIGSKIIILFERGVLCELEPICNVCMTTAARTHTQTITTHLCGGCETYRVENQHHILFERGLLCELELICIA